MIHFILLASISTFYVRKIWGIILKIKPQNFSKIINMYPRKLTKLINHNHKEGNWNVPSKSYKKPSGHMIAKDLGVFIHKISQCKFSGLHFRNS